MERVTISLDDDLLAQFDGYLKRKGYGEPLRGDPRPFARAAGTGSA